MRTMKAAGAALALVIAACGGGSGDSGTTQAPTTTTASAGDAAVGAEIYGSTCIACHGPDGVGIQGLGLPLADSDFVKGNSDAELVSFIEVGRLGDDPDNTTGIAMPAKGGNPALTPDDLQDVVAYLRTLNP